MNNRLKKWMLSIACMLLIVPSHAQDNGLSVITYKLPNGLTVMLNPDKNATTVFGAVAVKAGSKYDPANATGLGHYLEHMCFKGTQTMGTTNYAAEKPHLDTIVLLYDTLAKTTDEAQRKRIQNKINEVSIRAAQYAIPNEMDRLIQSIGGNNMNAFTSFEEIVYHNSFPSSEMEKWLDIYAERFTNPVFRLFQSELEVVYEEKNRMSDNFGSELMFKFLGAFWKNHPYGSQTTIGRTEDLKNPPLRQMMAYYDTYFVANNMALVITGNFDVEQTKKWIGEKFGKWKSGTVPKYPEYPENQFEGEQILSLNMSPVKIGALGFKAPKKNDKDNITMEVVNKLLNNSNQTGYLDKLQTESKLLGANFINIDLEDRGLAGIIYIPKLVGQSLESATKLIRETLDSLKYKPLDAEVVKAAKNGLILDFYRKMEDPRSRALILVNSYIYNQSWDSILNYPEKINAVTISEIQSLASSVFGNNFLNLQSKTGFPKKDKIEKPNYKAPTINTTVSSEYAQKFKAIPSGISKEHFIDLKKDIKVVTLSNNNKVYAANNPVNEIFNLEIRYDVSNLDDENIEMAAAYAGYLAPANMSFQKYKETLNQLGINFEISYANLKGLTIFLSGFESNLDTALSIANDFLLNVANNNDALKRLKTDFSAGLKLEFADPTSESQILCEYVRYGNNSQYLKRPSSKEIKNIDGNKLISSLKSNIERPFIVFYSGKTSAEALAKKLNNQAFLNPSNLNKTPSQKLESLSYNKPTAYVYFDKKSRQTHIYYYKNLGALDKGKVASIKLFNSYFGGDMSSIVFQQIRESRSLAYAARYTISELPTFSKNTFALGYIGCQADKTPQALYVMDSLLRDIPNLKDRFETLKEGNIALTSNARPAWRQLPQEAWNWERLGYSVQPEAEILPQMQNADFEGMMADAKQLLDQSSQALAIVGPKKNIPIKELKKNYTVVIVSEKDIRTK